MGFPLTQEQRQIVDDRGGELLVSAAAGSGKTRVLVERLLDRVTKERLDIDRFLVITYTKAAAAELRARVAQELSARLAERPTDRHLRRQTTLIYQAHISTIHSFCSTLLRESGHLLDLDPDFRLCDEGEAQVMMARTLEEVLDKRYEDLEPGGGFAQLADTMAAGRDDSRLAQIVLDIYSRVQSHPDPEQWLEGQRRVWDLTGVKDLSQTPWGALLLEESRRTAADCRERLAGGLELIGEDEILQMNCEAALSTALDGLDSFLAAKSWDESVACLPIPLPAFGRKKKRSIQVSPMEEERAASAGERIRSIRTRCKKRLDQMAEQMEGSSAQLMEELALSRPAVQALLDLVRDFQRAYAAEKRRRSLVDFSDLEHFAVKLLLDDAGNPTHLAQLWASRFEEVQVDEYQDTNQVQNAIFFAISREGRTLFQVGDVKQSIYRFRLADPTIFLEKYRRFAPGDQGEEGMPRKRVLSRNFRSRAQVLEGCNDLFRNIMSVELGELDYTEDQALVPGADFPAGEDYALELDALDLSFLAEQEGEKTSKDLLEARFAARRIRELLSKPLMVSEGEGQRPVRPSDIMLLLRSPGSVMHHYLRALEEEGIPWTADSGEDFFDTTEIQVALSLLQVVDNPRQDIPLIAVLRSPLYGFSGDKLALLRADGEGDFYSALVHGGEQGDEECRSFLNELERLRFGAGDRTCRQLIWHIYESTNMLGIFGAMEGGEERQEHLLALYALAGQLEEAGCRTLFQFLTRLGRMRERGIKLSAPGGGREGEGVSILSIHRSKGLEKPVVLVCGLSRRLNRDDLMRPVLFHPVLGVGPKGLDLERMIEYPTLARRAVARQLEREMLSEELRLLYVAMTRAKEKLILTLALTEGTRTLERLGEELSVPVSPMVLEEQMNVGQWVLLHALTRPEAAELRSLVRLPEIDGGMLGPAWDIRWVEGLTLNQSTTVGRARSALNQAAEEEAEALRTRFAWRYPYGALANIPSKITATQMKGRVLDREVEEEGQSAGERQIKHAPIHRPDLRRVGGKLSPTQRGVAIHLAMQYLPLNGIDGTEAVKRELERLVAQDFLTPAQAAEVKPEQLAAFLKSGLGREMAGAKECHREFKFSLLVPARNYYPEADLEAQVLLQGVIDAWFDDGQRLTVVDFKSDRLRPGDEVERGEVYRPQLETYSQALSAILGRPVERKVLWFFYTGTAVEL